MLAHRCGAAFFREIECFGTVPPSVMGASGGGGTVQMPPTRDGGAIQLFEICDIPATFLPPALSGRTGRTFSP